MRTRTRVFRHEKFETIQPGTELAELRTPPARIAYKDVIAAKKECLKD